jgi:hypothetical protein
MCSCDDVLRGGCYSNVVVCSKDDLSKLNDVKNVSKSEESVAITKIY